MSPDIIENPEEGRIYLVKRRVSGDIGNRFQPAKVLSLNEDHLGVKHAVIGWLYDDFLEDVVLYAGLMKTVSRKWLTNESRVLTERRLALEKAEAVVLAMSLDEGIV